MSWYLLMMCLCFRFSSMFLSLFLLIILVTLLQAEYGQTLAKAVQLLGKLTGSYGEPETTRARL